jgi:RsiW-degrading membrane proteinase PrsW (M82 family)
LFWDRTEVDLDFSYLVSFDSEEFRVPGSAASLGFAVVENEGFIVLFKRLLNLIRWGLLAIGPAAFEIGFAVNAIIVRTAEYEVVAQ